MEYSDYISEEPAFAGYPRNEVDIQLRNGRTRHLFVKNEALPPPREAIDTIEQAVQAYLEEHDEVLEAVIHVVEGPDERIPQRTVQG